MVPAMQFPSCENVSSGSTHILLVMTLGREGGVCAYYTYNSKNHKISFVHH